MKNIFTIGTCTFSFLHENPDGSRIYTISRHGMLISHGDTFPANADYDYFANWVKEHGYD